MNTKNILTAALARVTSHVETAGMDKTKAKAVAEMLGDLMRKSRIPAAKKVRTDTDNDVVYFRIPVLPGFAMDKIAKTLAVPFKGTATKDRTGGDGDFKWNLGTYKGAAIVMVDNTEMTGEDSVSICISYE